MQYRGDKVDAWVSGYAGYVRDFILFDYRPGGMMGPTSQASNVNARIAGGELGASWKVAPSWTLGATLAYAWGENRSDGRALPQIPPLEAKLSAAYDDGVGPPARSGAWSRRRSATRSTAATWSARTSAPARASACSR